jgi:membrane protein implicated in regulation of membrane protease activity
VNLGQNHVDIATMDAWVIWVIVATVFLVAELATGTLYLLIFAFSGYAATIAAAVGAGPLGQALTFSVCAVVGTAFVRPIIMKRIHPESADPSIGMEATLAATGIVATTIPETGSATTGTVIVRGETWTARSSGDPIPKGTQVRTVSIDGVTLVVEPITTTKETTKS